MNGYFLDLVRLARGTGARLLPRPAAMDEGGWFESEEEETVGHEPLRAAAATSGPLSNVTHLHGDVNVSSTNVVQESHAHPSSFEETAVFVEGESRTVCEEAVAARDDRVVAERTEVRESLRELVREARTIRERAERETQTVRHERETRQVGTERVREIERFAREIRETATQREVERTVEARVEAAAEPTVEIVIGRIDVRLPFPATPPVSEETKAKPRGVMELDEYLRQRREGVL